MMVCDQYSCDGAGMTTFWCGDRCREFLKDFPRLSHVAQEGGVGGSNGRIENFNYKTKNVNPYNDFWYLSQRQSKMHSNVIRQHCFQEVDRKKFEGGGPLFPRFSTAKK